jgi:hypothetical protein
LISSAAFFAFAFRPTHAGLARTLARQTPGAGQLATKKAFDLWLDKVARFFAIFRSKQLNKKILLKERLRII